MCDILIKCVNCSKSLINIAHHNQKVYFPLILQKDAWESAVGELKLGIDNKLDRMELDPLKAYLDKRIKAVDAKVIKKDFDLPEDAAGFRR